MLRYNVPLSKMRENTFFCNAKTEKNVLRFDLDGNLIGEYIFIDGYCKKADLKFSRIKHAVKPTNSNKFKTLSALNSIWILKEDFSQKELDTKVKAKKDNEKEYMVSKKKKIRQVCSKTKETIRIYDSISEAGQEHITGYSSRCIRRVLNGERKTYAGCYWEYVQ